MTRQNKDALKQFGQRFKEAQQASGMTQRAFCDAVGISVVTFNSYANGNSNPSLTNLQNIATVAGVDVGWLITGQGEMNASGYRVQDQAQRNRIRDLVKDGLVSIEEEESRQRKRINAELKAEIISELVSDGLKDGTDEVDETNVVRFVKFAGGNNG
jgi:transcriptional regulator with XRE-family HTH domain